MTLEEKLYPRQKKNKNKTHPIELLLFWKRFCVPILTKRKKKRHKIVFTLESGTEAATARAPEPAMCQWKKVLNISFRVCWTSNDDCKSMRLGGKAVLNTISRKVSTF